MTPNSDSVSGVSGGSKQSQELHHTPWYISVLTAISAWVASCFLMGFVALLLFDHLHASGVLSTVMGVFFLVVSYLLQRDATRLFLVHCSLSVGLVGHVLLFFGLFDTVGPGLLYLLLLIGLELLLLVLISMAVHRFVITLLLAFIFAVIATHYGFLALYIVVVHGVFAWLWCNEFNYVGRHRFFSTVGYALTCFAVLLVVSFGQRDGELFELFPLLASVAFGYGFGSNSGAIMEAAWLPYEALQVLLAGVLGGVAWQVCRTFTVPVRPASVVLLVIAIVALTFLSIEMYGVLTGVLIITLGFYHSNKILLALGFLTLLGFVIHYYYLLDYTLLAKAQSLGVLGVALLAGYGVMRALSRFGSNGSEASPNE